MVGQYVGSYRMRRDSQKVMDTDRPQINNWLIFYKIVGGHRTRHQIALEKEKKKKTKKLKN